MVLQASIICTAGSAPASLFVSVWTVQALVTTSIGTSYILLLLFFLVTLVDSIIEWRHTILFRHDRARRQFKNPIPSFIIDHSVFRLLHPMLLTFSLPLLLMATIMF